MDPHCVLCDDKLHSESVLVGTQEGSFNVIDPIPYFVIISTGTFTETLLCTSSQSFNITFSISSATTKILSR